MTTTPTQDRHRRIAIYDGPDPIDVAVGARLRRLRIAVGMTQQQLAEAVDVRYQQVQKYETGHNRISASRLVHCARVLGCSPASFFTEIEAPETDRRPTLAALRTAAKIDKLPPHAREGFTRILDYALCAATEHDAQPSAHSLAAE